MIRSRIAPTPSGYLHIGNALNFILIWLEVRRAGGRLRLRIDDCDTTRSRQEYVEDVFRTLEWMGMDWDEGPQTVADVAVFSQSLRAEIYDRLIQQLIATGRVYACHCSRHDLQIRPCHCRELNLDMAQPDTALRIVTPAEPILVHDRADTRLVYLNDEMKDFIIRRRDGLPAYQVVSLADDIDHEINLIIRGQDMLGSTAAQLYLASLIGNDDFAKASFYHHSLIMDESGKKLSKSAGSLSLKAMREAGMVREEFYSRISSLLGMVVEYISLEELLWAGAGADSRIA